MPVRVMTELQVDSWRNGEVVYLTWTLLDPDWQREMMSSLGLPVPVYGVYQAKTAMAKFGVVGTSPTSANPARR